MENTNKCSICGKFFKGKRSDSKTCSKSCKTERSRINTQNYRRRKAKLEGRLDRVDIGRGGGQAKGSESPHYKNGIRYFHDVLSPLVKEQTRFCERCNKDLIDAKHNFWGVHHKDHDRENNTLENMELLCKRCHQIEHECWKAFNV